MNEEQKIMHDLFKNLSSLLGGEWVFESNNFNGFSMKRPNLDFGYYIKIGDRKSWEVTGVWPKDSRGQWLIPDLEDRPRINVSKKRGPEGLAKDIVRRFDAQYRKTWDQCVANGEAADKAHAAYLEALEKIAAALGKTATDHERNRGEALFRPNCEDISGVRVTGSSVLIETGYLTPEKAVKAIELLKTL